MSWLLACCLPFTAYAYCFACADVDGWLCDDDLEGLSHQSKAGTHLSRLGAIFFVEFQVSVSWSWMELTLF